MSKLPLVAGVLGAGSILLAVNAARGSAAKNERLADTVTAMAPALQQLRAALHAVSAPAGSADRTTAKRSRPGAPSRPTAPRLRAVADAFLKIDPRAASDADLVAVLLAGGTSGDPLLAATELLHDLGGNLARVSRAEGFLSRPGFAPMTRARALASAELARRASLVGAIEGIGSSIRTATDAEQLARALAGGTTEKFIGIYFDRRLRLVGFRVLSAGNSASVIVDPVEVFRPAIEMHASAVIVAHNHPSGDGTPSREDDQVTRRLAEGCATLGLVLLDHVILGRAGNFTSYAQRGSPHLSASPTSPLFTG